MIQSKYFSIKDNFDIIRVLVMFSNYKNLCKMSQMPCNLDRWGLAFCFLCLWLKGKRQRITLPQTLAWFAGFPPPRPLSLSVSLLHTTAHWPENSCIPVWALSLTLSLPRSSLFPSKQQPKRILKPPDFWLRPPMPSHLSADFIDIQTLKTADSFPKSVF